MSIVKERDLKFLEKCSNEDLKELVECLIYDEKKNPRLTESLTLTPEYKIYKDDYKKYLNVIIEELECFGGNTVANMFRLGKGVSYREIVKDIAKIFKIPFFSQESTEDIENKLLTYIFTEAWKVLSEEDKKEMLKEMGLSETNLMAQGAGALALYVFKLGGFKSYQLSVIIANYIWRLFFKKGLTLAANRTLTKTLSILAGPIGWGLTGIWTLVDIASPATRVTIPAVVCIATLRKKVAYENNNL